MNHRDDLLTFALISLILTLILCSRIPLVGVASKPEIQFQRRFSPTLATLGRLSTWMSIATAIAHSIGAGGKLAARRW